MKTIVFIDETAKIGGAEMNLLRILPRLQEEGWKPILLVPAEGPLLEKLAVCGVSTQVVMGGRFYSVSSYVGKRRKVPNPMAWVATLINGMRWSLSLEQVIRQIQPDIVQTVSMLSHLFGGLAAQRAGFPVVSHVQDIVAESSGLGIYHAVFQIWARRIPLRMLCVSPLVATQFEHDQVAKQKTNVIWNTMDIQKFQPSGFPHESNARKVRIGTVARLTRWKGQDVALQVAKCLKTTGLDFQWEFVGDAALGEENYRRELYEQVNQLQLEREVSFIGWQDDMIQFYRSWDVLVHLPIEPDPAPLVITEALLSGLPVITSHSGLDEIVQEAGGSLVLAGDAKSATNAILDLLKGLQSNRAAYQEKARTTALKYFSPQVIVPQWLDLYEGILAP